MVIYVDEMFFENFIMNYLIIYMTGFVLKSKVRWYRNAFGATLGAIYVILSYILNITIYQEVIFKFILSILIILVSFNIKTIKEFTKLFSCFYLITFMLGGASFGLAYLLNIKIDRYGNVFYIEKFPLQMIVIAVTIVLILVKILSIFIKKVWNFNEIIFPIEIFLNNKSILVNVFLDTGNNVKEPYTNRYVIFVEIETLKKLLPYTIYEVLKNCDEINKISDSYWKRKFSIIPFSTVGLYREIIFGIKPDKVVIYKDGKRLVRENVVLGVCKRKLSKESNYEALIGSGLFE